MACMACGFRLYFNPAVAVAVFVQDAAGRVLLIRRAKEPGAGKLAPPGGFIDVGERAEDAVHREVHEEVGLRLTDLRFLGSQPNEYLFGGVLYPVLDLFFKTRVRSRRSAGTRRPTWPPGTWPFPRCGPHGRTGFRQIPRLRAAALGIGSGCDPQRDL